MIDLNKTMPVNAIQHGTVIDHISAHQALKIVKILHLDKHQKQVTLGLNLPSRRLQYKDIIKVEGWELSPEEVNGIALLSPHATISIIQNFEIINKFNVSVPPFVESMVICPNQRCVSNFENISSFFYIRQRHSQIHLQCKYCQKNFTREEIGFKINR